MARGGLLAPGGLGRDMRPAPRTSALDAILDGVRYMHLALYSATAREVKAIGVSVDASTFERVALMIVERMIPSGAVVPQEIIDAGFIDFETSIGGSAMVKMRISREDTIGPVDPLPSLRDR